MDRGINLDAETGVSPHTAPLAGVTARCERENSHRDKRIIPKVGLEPTRLDHRQICKQLLSVRHDSIRPIESLVSKRVVMLVKDVGEEPAAERRWSIWRIRT
jgi:hypothetical protein